MQSLLLMEEILLTSWGWSFIPLFRGQYLIESRISSELEMLQEALRCLEVEWKGGFPEKKSESSYLGGGFTYFLFSPLPGEMIQFDEHIFHMGGSTTN